MTDKKVESFDFDSSNLIVFLTKWRKPLFYVSLAAALASLVFSMPFFIKPKFKSTVILFPTSTNSISKALLSENNTAKQDVMEFGVEEQAEQLLQILNSDEIRERIIQKYDLMHHYNIDTNQRYKYTKLYEEYEGNISYRRTEFLSVQIDVYDTDPQIAADISNDIAALLDTAENRMQKERAMKGMKVVEEEYTGMKNYIKGLEDSLDALRRMGINDYESQSERMNEGYAKAILEGKKTAVEEFEKKLKILAQFGGSYVSIRDLLKYEKVQLTRVRAKYQEAKVDAEQNLPHKFIVNNGHKAEKKSYPLRWLIVVVSTISAFLICVIIIVIIENVRKYKERV